MAAPFGEVSFSMYQPPLSVDAYAPDGIFDDVICAAEATSELYSGPAEYLPEPVRAASPVSIALGSRMLTLTDTRPSIDGAQLIANYRARFQEPYGLDCE